MNWYAFSLWFGLFTFFFGMFQRAQIKDRKWRADLLIVAGAILLAVGIAALKSNTVMHS